MAQGRSAASCSAYWPHPYRANGDRAALAAVVQRYPEWPSVDEVEARRWRIVAELEFGPLAAHGAGRQATSISGYQVPSVTMYSGESSSECAPPAWQAARNPASFRQW